MQRYKKEKATFGNIHSEKILQLTLLFKLGVEVFDTKEQFNVWLETDNVALGKIKPKELLDNSFGIDMIKDELLRIEHGVLA
jgi:putative toxin-antitoxin system antitoxin component (TIGR02293 family)